jgi:DNA-binding SARP family transcriptional activator/tetratricopeptide (TPR) repeat protein
LAALKGCGTLVVPARFGFRMEFRILGPVEVLAEGRRLALPGSKQRALLAMLLLHRGETLGTERLIEELWGENPPAGADKALQVHISRLRKALIASAGEDAAGLVVTRAHGYALDLDPECLDTHRFERLLGEGREELAAGRPRRPAALLEEALSLWRGRPLDDLAYEAFAQHEIGRLEELHITARERLAEAQMALGQHAEVVGQLESLIADHPYRERLHAHLMLALYRCDRQADALQTYQEARRMLIEDLGIEPGERLRELERQILAQDPALELHVLADTESQPVPEVGTSVADRGAEAPPPPVQPAPSARRLVSIVFADLVGSTALAERLDPEAMHLLLDRFTAVSSEVIERHGGSVEGFIGDAVVGVFGQAEIHEDDALRAVRVAVELRQAGAVLSNELEHELGAVIGIKLGVESGEVFVSPGARRSRFAAGDAFNVAARLEGMAAGGEILLGANIHELVKDQIRAEPLEALQLEGRVAKVLAWRLIELIEDAAGFAGRPTPLVNREQELSELHSEFARCRAAPECRMATLVGAAGIGKSRLAREFASQVGDDATVVVGRCLSYGEDITYRPLADIVRQLCGLEPTERLRELLGADETRVRLVLQAIGMAAGAAQPEETAWAVRSLLERVAQERPLVVAVEDVHWAEPPMLDLLDYLGVFSSDHPILILCLARPELGDTRPQWMAPGANRSLLVLDPLSDDDARALVGTAAATELGAAAERIVKLAEGNPLFLEQLAAVQMEDDSPLPSTIQAVLAARIDRLAPGERAVLEHASVQGRGLYVGGVVALLPQLDRAEVAGHVVSLVHKKLMRPDRSDIRDEDAFRFSHVLIREVAYQGLPRGRRAELHEQLAEWLAAWPGPRDDMIGFHLAEAYLNRAALGPIGRHERAIAAAAVKRLSAAAEAARLRGDPAAGARLLERAETVVGADAEARGELLPELGAALYDAGRLDEAAETLDEAVEHSTAGPLRARAQIERELVRLETDPEAGTAQAERVAREGLDLLDRTQDLHGACRAWFLRGYVAWIAGRAGDADEFWTRSAQCAGRAGAERERFEVVGWRAMAAAQGPAQVEDAIRRCEEFGELVKESPHATVWILHPLALLRAMNEDLDGACELLAEADRIRTALGGLSSGFSHLEAWARLSLGQPELAETRLRADVETLASMSGKGTLATTLAVLAKAVLVQGRVDEAGALSAATQREAATGDTMTQMIWRGVGARVAARQGRAEEGESLARAGVELADSTDLISLRGDAKLDLADVLRTLGRGEEAEQAAQEGLALYRSKGNAAAAREAEALLSH